MLLFWLLFGALVGAHAAQKRGFSVVGGVIGGLLLGLFAPLMYLAAEHGRKCPFCAERVRLEAKVCKHCHKELPQRPRATPIPSDPAWDRTATRTVALFVLAAIIIVLLVSVFHALSARRDPSAAPQSQSELRP